MRNRSRPVRCAGQCPISHSPGYIARIRSGTCGLPLSSPASPTLAPRAARAATKRERKERKICRWYRSYCSEDRSGSMRYPILFSDRQMENHRRVSERVALRGSGSWIRWYLLREENKTKRGVISSRIDRRSIRCRNQLSELPRHYCKSSGNDYARSAIMATVMVDLTRRLPLN